MLPRPSLNLRSTNPNVPLGRVSIVIATAVVVVDHNGNDAGGGLPRFGGGERSPPPVSLLPPRRRGGGGGLFRAGTCRGALYAPQGQSRRPRRRSGRLVVLHFDLALCRRWREELRLLLLDPLSPWAAGLERALLLARLVPRGLAEFGTFSGEKNVRVPPRRLGRLHFKSVVIVELQRKGAKWAGRWAALMNELPPSPLWHCCPSPSSTASESDR